MMLAFLARSLLYEEKNDTHKQLDIHMRSVQEQPEM